AQKQPGFEADRWRLMVVEADPSGSFAGKPESVTERLAGKSDLSVDELGWIGNESVYFTADENARRPLFQVPLPPSGGSVVTLGGVSAVSSVSAGPGGKVVAFT